MKYPHILIIVMDTVRFFHLSCYGYQRNTTPNIDLIAEEGVIFDQAISTSTWTLPTHASILTGMYSSKHGAHNQHQRLSNKYVTLPEYLNDIGYKSVAFSNNPYFSRSMKLDRGFQEFVELWHNNIIAQYKANVRKLIMKCLKKHDKGAYAINRSIKSWFKMKFNPEIPSFIFINYLEPHLPYKPPYAFSKLYLGENIKQDRIKKVNQNYVKYIGKNVEMSDEDFYILKALYDSEITYLDYTLAQLFDEFKNRNIIDNTIIIITSDHGDNIGEHEKMGHEFSVSENILRIPLIIRFPSIFEGGKRISHPVQLVDIFSTIVDILNVENDYTKTELQGKSLAPGKWAEFNNRFTISELYRPKLSSIKKRYSHLDLNEFFCDFKVLRYNDYKYIRCSNGNNQLFNLKRDPSETKNLLNLETKRAVEMAQMLEVWENSFKMHDSKNEYNELDIQTEERLRALGYLD